MKRVLGMLMFVVGIVFVADAFVETYDISTKEECADLPLVVYARKSHDGLIYFDVVYREMVPFSSSTLMHVVINDGNEKKIFGGMVGSIESFDEDGVRYFMFSMRETDLNKSYISLSTEWDRKKSLVKKFRVDGGRISLDINLRNLYDWNQGYSDRLYASGTNDKRLIELIGREAISLEEWRESRKVTKDLSLTTLPTQGTEGGSGSQKIPNNPTIPKTD